MTPSALTHPVGLSPPAAHRPSRASSLATDGRALPVAPFGRGPGAARVLRGVIDAGAWTGSRTPSAVAHALAGAGGTLEWAARAAKRGRLTRNLAHAVGLPDDDPAVARLVRAELRNEARRSADLLWARGNRDAARAATAIEGREHMVAALDRGRGAILAGLHLGGWEIAGAIAEDVIPGQTTAVVADDWLAWAMERRRRAAGLHTIPRSGAGLRAARALRAGGTLLLLGDDCWGAEPRCHRVRFLDAVASLPAGIVSLARLCQSPIVCFTFLPEAPRRWVGRFEPPVDPPARDEGDEGEQRALQLLADRWTTAIRSAPAHWAASFPIRWETA